MNTSPFLAALSLFTLVAVVAFAFWQYGSVRRSQARRNEPTGTLTHTNLSADGDFTDAHTPAPHTRTGQAGLHPEPVGADNTRSAALPPS